MRRQGVKLRLVTLAGVLVAAASLGSATMVEPQSQFPQPQQIPRLGGPPVVLNEPDDNPALTERMAKERNAMRQKKLVEKMERLQRLTAELKQEVDKTNKDMLSLDVVRKSEEIEKLARSIKELMIGPV